ncbi:flavin reductase family protein [Sulfolobus tengchongensis]|uniref:Flavin reductase family protein n=1 Tax=Sulfolobus tengchongensis TaxID=207809 RepID=A0AAX4L3S2_9CREN
MSETIRSIMRLFPLGVVVITTKWSDNLVGMTVNTFNSLSLNPPLILFAADRTKGNDIPFKESNGFVVNFIDNEKILDAFAFKPVKERFNGVKFFEGFEGLPILADSYAYMEAKKYVTYDIGDHTLIVGEVVNGKFLRDNFEPLVYYNRNYWKLRR